MTNTTRPAEEDGGKPIGIIDDDGAAWAYGVPGGKFSPGTLLYGAPGAAAAACNQAAQDVLAERRRQIEAEGWTPEHDDEHTAGELAQAAADLCVFGTDFRVVDPDGDRMIGWGLTEAHRDDRRRQLVIAGALVVAEIERIDRAAQTQGGSA